MKSHVHPTMKRNPPCVILHCGTNDLTSKCTSIEITRNLVTLDTELKDETNEIIISDIIARKDKWDDKGKLVNEQVKIMCSGYDIGYLNNNNISKKTDLDLMGLHLEQGDGGGGGGE